MDNSDVRSFEKLAQSLCLAYIADDFPLLLLNFYLQFVHLDILCFYVIKYVTFFRLWSSVRFRGLA